MPEQRIQQHFINSADLLYQAAPNLALAVASAAQAIVHCITGGGKILVAGLGPQQALADYLVARLLNGYERQRPGLAAVVLRVGVVRAEREEDAFSHQVYALGQPGDVLLILDDDSESSILHRAVEAAFNKEMTAIATTHATMGGNMLLAMLRDVDVKIDVSQATGAQVLELQLVVLHALCSAIDYHLLGEEDME